jgi:hypothetical protein
MLAKNAGAEDSPGAVVVEMGESEGAGVGFSAPDVVEEEEEGEGEAEGDEEEVAEKEEVGEEVGEEEVEAVLVEVVDEVEATAVISNIAIDAGGIEKVYLIGSERKEGERKRQKRFLKNRENRLYYPNK